MKLTTRTRMALHGVLGLGLFCSAGMLLASGGAAFALQDAPAAPAADELPSGKEIISKHVEATGGEEAYKNRKSVVTKAKLAIPMAGVTADMVIYQVAPNKMATKLDLGELGTQESVFDGQWAWEVSTMTGPRLLSDEEAGSMKRQAAFDVQYNPDKYYTSIETVKKTQFADEEAYEVKLTSKDDETVTQYYSVESGWMIGQTSVQPSQMGDVESKVIMRDYREVGGMKVPFKTVIELPAMGMTQILNITSVEVDAEVDPEVFAMPEEIKALKDQKEQKG